MTNEDQPAPHNHGLGHTHNHAYRGEVPLHDHYGPEAKYAFVPTVLEQPGERGTKVRHLSSETVEPLRAQIAHPRQPLTRLELLRDAEEVVVVATTQ